MRRYLNILIWCFFVIWFIIEFTLIENSFFIIFLYLTSSAVSDNSLSEEEITGFCEKSKSSDCNFCCFFFSLSLVFFFLCYTSAITLWIIVCTLMCFQLQSLIVLRMNRAVIREDYLFGYEVLFSLKVKFTFKTFNILVSILFRFA